MRSVGALRRQSGVASPCASTSSAIAAPNLVIHPPGKRMKLYSELLTSHNRVCRPCNSGGKYFLRFMSTMDHPEVSSKQEEISIASIEVQQPQWNKFKRPDKTARHIMNISDKEEVGKVQAEREIPDIIPGYIIQLKVILTQHLGDQSAGQEESEERMNPYKGS